MKNDRKFLPQSFEITTWENLQPYFDTILEMPIDKEETYETFLANVSELDSVISEDLAWRYIKMTCDSSNEDLEKRYLDFVTNIQPNVAPYEDKINQKVMI